MEFPMPDLLLVICDLRCSCENSVAFQPAQLLDPSGLIDATAQRAECVQHSDKWDMKTVEDCLWVNILAPLVYIVQIGRVIPQNISSSSNLPVYTWIHGGALVEGDCGVYSSAYHNLINRGPLIMVSISYRLGPFGNWDSFGLVRLLQHQNLGSPRKYGIVGPDRGSSMDPKVR